MNIPEPSAQIWAIMILGSASLFTILWFMDAMTHKKIVGTEITNSELTTHRILISTSMLMELSLVAMFWNSMIALPLFIAAFITRTAHEFIDELHFHTERCTPRETFLHLGMWLSVLIKTSTMFIWGFFANYDGVLELSPLFYVWAVLIVISMIYTSYIEWNQGK